MINISSEDISAQRDNPEQYMITTSSAEEENELLRESLRHLEGELDKFKRAPLIIGTVVDFIDHKKAVVRLPGGEFYVNVIRSLEQKIKPNDRVLLEQKSLTVVERMGKSKAYNTEHFVIMNKPTVGWNQIGGLKTQIEEVKEVIELPLTKPELFRKIGIEPPKGILLHGPPGTGKTLLAKAVAKNTNSTFIEIVGSELVQKFIGQGAKLVKSIFQMAREKSPAIIFIDEIDAIACQRVELGTSGEREVQRTFMQLLAEIDGFKPLGNVKIIGATNRMDILDSAVMRPGRLERMMAVPLPDEEGRKEIFRIHTKNMRLEKDVELEEIVKKTQKMSGAELKAICTEAGYFAIRMNRTSVSHKNFLDAVKKIKKEEKSGNKDYLRMYGE